MASSVIDIPPDHGGPADRAFTAACRGEKVRVRHDNHTFVIMTEAELDRQQDEFWARMRKYLQAAADRQDGTIEQILASIQISPEKRIEMIDNSKPQMEVWAKDTSDVF